ncbi:hypothetical protein So717_33670 [Roseobacter cerasinus]|uniref:Intracellular septation protein A n=1 Tax=Roseobacter cerasinus TaxID=2602289 RepID=A0A640VVJ0_9RHOB|nr:hypothetical protein [Roseobacter cerasinus]GFE51614.1 hypothetical protein So717_33670 [Roseobacter cerasinus]
MPGIVISMLPWLMFPPLLDWTDQNVFKAALVALVVSLCLSGRRLLQGYAADWTVVGSMALIATLSLSSAQDVVRAHWPLIMPFGLTCMCWTSIALRRPFTIPYAKAETPSDHWDSPIFLQINMWISAIWGTCFGLALVASLLAAAFHPLWPIFLIAKYLLILSAMVLSRLFPDFYIARLEAKADA